jgi:hypothetical protein
MKYTKEQLRMQQFAGIITESQYKKLIKENSNPKSFLEDLFMEYLEGGDGFEEEPGEISKNTWEGDVFTDEEEYDIEFVTSFKEIASLLKGKKITIQLEDEPDYGDIKFTSPNGIDITASFIVPEDEY